MKILHFLNKTDTLEAIAKLYNVSVNSILEFNNLKLNDPLPQKLQIIVNNDDYVVVKNFKRNFLLTLSDEINFETIKKNLLVQGLKTDAKQVEEFDKVLFQKQNLNVYVVGVLETLDSIAAKFALNKNEIIKKNNLKNEKLFIGQMLNL